MSFLFVPKVQLDVEIDPILSLFIHHNKFNLLLGLSEAHKNKCYFDD